MRIILALIGIGCTLGVKAQFHPPAGQAGTSAIHKDSTIITAWATGCTVVRGYQNITNTAVGYTTSGNDSSAIGIADGANVVSLGDGGTATLTFAASIYNGAGYDFCVYENSFSANFLELAFVEVSSDGINFFRFQATSNTQDTLQTSSFGFTDATLLNNLAGKYQALYGVPFDLQELSGTPGLDINNVTHVRVVDVVGNIESPYATYDQNNNAVNDPWPTEFPSGGFDLDAIGVIHQNPENLFETANQPFHIFPVPCSNLLTIAGTDLQKTMVELYSYEGRVVSAPTYITENKILVDVSILSSGMYVLHIVANDYTYSYSIYKE